MIKKTFFLLLIVASSPALALRSGNNQIQISQKGTHNEQENPSTDTRRLVIKEVNPHDLDVLQTPFAQQTGLVLVGSGGPMLPQVYFDFVCILDPRNQRLKDLKTTRQELRRQIKQHSGKYSPTRNLRPAQVIQQLVAMKGGRGIDNQRLWLMNHLRNVSLDQLELMLKEFAAKNKEEHISIPLAMLHAQNLQIQQQIEDITEETNGIQKLQGLSDEDCRAFCTYWATPFKERVFATIATSERCAFPKEIVEEVLNFSYGDTDRQSKALCEIPLPTTLAIFIQEKKKPIT